MPNPRVEAMSQAFAQSYMTLELIEEREGAKKAFSEGLIAQGDEFITFETLLRTGDLINEDLTNFARTPTSIAPISPQEARTAIDSKKSEVPWYRRAIAKTAAAAEWWNTNVVEPTVAVSLATAVGAIPGEQTLERRIEENRRRLEAEGALAGKSNKLKEFIQASTAAYRDVDMPWGVKGSMELILDPLNLIGLGIPGKAMKLAPALRPILFPLHAIDRAPDVAVRKIIGAGAAATGSITGLKQLKAPHITSQVKRVGQSVNASATGAFTPEQFATGTALDTAQALGRDLTLFPDNSSPFSMRNIWNHVEQAFPATLTGEKAFAKFVDDIHNLPPQAAVAKLSAFTEDLERKALVRGGTKITGEVVEGDLRQRRVKTIGGILEKLQIDENIARGVAEGIDNQIYLYWDSIWLRKIEPTIIRPWAVANLAFSGFFVMNVVEDVAMATLGMGGLSRKGFNDESFRVITRGLPVPSDMLRAGEKQRLLLDSGPGLYNEAVKPKNALVDITKKTFLWPVTLSSSIGAGIRRSAWTNRYFKEFDNVLRESGISNQEISGIRDFLQGELPESLHHLRDEIGGKVWAAATTGNPQDIRDLHTAFTSASIIQKSQMDVLLKSPDLPTDVRRAYQKILANNPITNENMSEVSNLARRELLEWHKFSAEGVRDQYSSLIAKLQVRPPKTAAEATGLLASFQTAFDELTQLPREIQAHAKHRASLVPKTERQTILDESLDVISEEIGKSRAQTTEALALARPSIESLMVSLSDDPIRSEAIRQSVDEMFAGYKEISENLDRTWNDYRAAKQAHFDTTPPEERGDWFWSQLEEIGEETWSSEYEFRSQAANQIRSGWLFITDNLPTNLVPQDRTFIKNNLDAMINDAEAKINKMATEREDALFRLNNTGAHFRPVLENRITRLGDQIIVADSQQKALMDRLDKIVPIHPTRSTVRELGTYDENISLLNIAMGESRKAGLVDNIPKLENDLAELLAEREEVFQKLIPETHRPEWNDLQRNREQLATTGTNASIGDNEAAISRFRRKIETGSADDEVRRISDNNTQTIARLANRILQDGSPTSLDELKRRVDDLAQLGDPSASAFVQGLDNPATNFSATDIVAQVKDKPVVFPRRKLKKATSTDILNRTLEFGGSTTNIIGDDIKLLAQSGEAGRFNVAAYPELTLTIPFDDGSELAIQQFADEHIALLRKENHFLGTWHDTETDEIVLDIAVSVDSQADASRLAVAHDQNSIWDNISGQEIRTEDIVEPFVSAQEQVMEQLYAKIAEQELDTVLDSTGRSTLARISAGDVYPTETLDKLVEAGFVTEPVKLKNGKFRASVTEQGRLAQAQTRVQRSIDDVMANRPPPTRELDNLIDEKMASLETINDEMLRLWDNPPLRTEQEGEIGTYLNKVAGYMDSRPNVNTEFKVAREEAAKRANVEYNRWFTNYDDRSTLDYVMQRFMPFWMYESRRWPRLASLAASRPVLAKHLALVGGDWDYGYTPTVFGNEFNPLKGTGAGAVRRTLARDFPEYNTGYRGKIEQGLDWFARGAFYFNPLITAGVNIAQGESGAIAPPPLSLILNSMVAAGVELPPPLHNLAFDSRYTQFIIDQVIADNFKLNPQEVRNLAENGNEVAIAQLYSAEKEAAVRQIVLTQTSVLRYRPDAKREFGESMEQAIERIVGIPVSMTQELRKLGISYSEVVAVSGAQRQALFDAVPGAEAWLGASLSLKPVEEQKAQRSVSNFWRAIESSREANVLLQQDNSDEWINGRISGPAALDERSALARERGAIFNSLHSLPEFNDVPVSMEERQAYLSKFGKPSPMTSPVDEALEQYFSITAEQFLDMRTGDTNWGAYFDAQKALLETYDEPVRSLVDQEIRRSETVLDRTLEIYSPLLRDYYGVRSDVVAQIEQVDPEIAQVYSEYRRLMNFAQIAITPQEEAAISQQARILLAINPQLAMAEAIIRKTRERLRKQDANMERAYQLFISRPGSVPRPSTGRINMNPPGGLNRLTPGQGV